MMAEWRELSERRSLKADNFSAASSYLRVIVLL